MENTITKEPPRLRIIAHRPTMLGIKATVAVYRGNQEIFCDEVKLWQVNSREQFIKSCTKLLGRTSRDFRERVDEMLRKKNQELSRHYSIG